MKKSRLAVLQLLMTAVTLALVFTLMVKTGIFPGLSPAQSDKKVTASEALKNEMTIPGTIYDVNGTPLAWTDGESMERCYIDSYRYSPLFAYESGGLEQLYYKELFTHGEEKLTKDNKTYYKGGYMTLTIDDRLQAKASALLEGMEDASIVVMNNDGGVECMASSKTFNINTVAEDYDELEKTEDGLLNPAKDKLSPVGSVLKPIVGQMLVDTGNKDFQIEDKGFVTIDGERIYNHNAAAYGSLGLKDALKYSSNAYFIKAGLLLGDGMVTESFEEFTIGESISTDFGELTSMSADSYTNQSLAMKILGQNVSLSTTQLCVITKAIVTGENTRPFIIEKATKDDTILAEGHHDDLGKTSLSSHAIRYVNKLMTDCGESYGLSEDIVGVKVLAKTGSAEDADGRNTATLITAWPAHKPVHFMVMQERSTDKYGVDLAEAAGSFIRYYQGMQKENA